MSKIGQWIAEDMENHPELYDGDNEPDFGND